MNATLRPLFALVPAPRARLALGALLAAATVLFGVGLMATAGYLISRAAERPDILSLGVAIVAVRFFGLARPLSRYLERLVSHDVALRVLGRARVRAYERIEPLAPAQLEGYRRGDLLSRMVADVDALQNLHLRGLLPPLAAIVAGSVSVAVTAAFSPAAALVLAAGLLVGAVVAPLVAPRRGPKLAPERGELTAEVVDVLCGAPELAVYGSDDLVARLRERNDALARLSRRAAFADGAGDGLLLLVTGATVCGVLAVAVDAQIDRVLIAMLALLALSSFEAVQPLAQAARELGETIAAGRRIIELTDQEPAFCDREDAAALPIGGLAIAFEGVRAPYALDGLTFRLDPGRKVALVGPSGAGKTTAVNLLLRFLDPKAGRITLNGRDLHDYRQEDVRRAIAVAGQDSHLFSTTIRENVRLARPGAGDAEIEEALRRARLWDWVSSLPDGWHTLVGEEGRELSGGQRQRIVLARALLARAPVLVLDEPTAHLDAPTAERLIDDVLDAAGDTAVLLITHRPEGLDRMDEIVAVTSRSPTRR